MSEAPTSPTEIRPGLLTSLVTFAGLLSRYFLYRLGVGKMPTVERCYPQALRVISWFMGWDHNLRVVNAERCPRDLPCIFASNHMFRDDPFIMFRAIYDATDGITRTRIMMRDDFFAKPNLGIIDLNEITEVLGTRHISRTNVQLKQLKPFINLLREGLSFMMFPSRTRTRTGLFVEYRGEFTEPGGVSFFLGAAQKRRDDVKVAAVPIARTVNPVSKMTTFVFGHPRFLEQNADKDAQRELDYGLIHNLAELVEVNVPQLLAAVLYSRAVHGLEPTVNRNELQAQLAVIIRGLEQRTIAPEAKSDLAGEIGRTLKYFKKTGHVILKSDSVEVDTAAVLFTPEPDKAYRKNNALRYLVNQIVHLEDVTQLVEEVMLTGSRDHA